MNRHRTPSTLNMLAGLWLVVSPFLLGYAFYRPAMWNDVIVGGVVAVLAAGRAFGHLGAWAAWTNVLLGAWLLAAPAMFNYGGAGVAGTNDVVTGVAIAALAIASAFAQPHNERAATYARRYRRDEAFTAAEPTDEELRRR